MKLYGAIFYLHFKFLASLKSSGNQNLTEYYLDRKVSNLANCLLLKPNMDFRAKHILQFFKATCSG